MPLLFTVWDSCVISCMDIMGCLCNLQYGIPVLFSGRIWKCFDGGDILLAFWLFSTVGGAMMTTMANTTTLMTMIIMIKILISAINILSGFNVLGRWWLPDAKTTKILRDRRPCKSEVPKTREYQQISQPFRRRSCAIRQWRRRWRWFVPQRGHEMTNIDTKIIFMFNCIGCFFNLYTSIIPRFLTIFMAGWSGYLKLTTQPSSLLNGSPGKLEARDLFFSFHSFFHCAFILFVSLLAEDYMVNSVEAYTINSVM